MYRKLNQVFALISCLVQIQVCVGIHNTGQKDLELLENLLSQNEHEKVMSPFLRESEKNDSTENSKDEPIKQELSKWKDEQQKQAQRRVVNLPPTRGRTGELRPYFLSGVICNYCIAEHGSRCHCCQYCASCC